MHYCENVAQGPCWPLTVKTQSSITEVCAHPLEVSAAASGYLTLLILRGMFGGLSQVVP